MILGETPPYFYRFPGSRNFFTIPGETYFDNNRPYGCVTSFMKNDPGGYTLCFTQTSGVKTTCREHAGSGR